MTSPNRNAALQVEISVDSQKANANRWKKSRMYPGYLLRAFSKFPMSSNTGQIRPSELRVVCTNRSSVRLEDVRTGSELAL
jgi:hypothetical protein